MKKVFKHVIKIMMSFASICGLAVLADGIDYYYNNEIADCDEEPSKESVVVFACAITGALACTLSAIAGLLSIFNWIDNK